MNAILHVIRQKLLNLKLHVCALSFKSNTVLNLERTRVYHDRFTKRQTSLC